MEDAPTTEPQRRTGRPERGQAEGLSGDAALDQAAADEARLRYRRRGVVCLDPDERIAPLLESGERLVAVRRSAVAYRTGTLESVATPPVVVDLYVTSRRLVLAGPDLIFFDLATLDAPAESNERPRNAPPDRAGP